MTSGVGSWGSTGRCYPFWQDYQQCVASVPNKFDRAALLSCSLYKEDYLECISRAKENARIAQFSEKLQGHDVKELIEQAAFQLEAERNRQ
mmetsp:Transcript_14852/g.20741  ORF Transcript_14852/g.20741 Transcript_14852/m.20741 type:complete len:91 (-) Transcript_14852:51-323(-)